MTLTMRTATRREGSGSYLDYGASRPLYIGRELIRYIQYGRGCSPRHYIRTKGDSLRREMIAMGCDLKAYSSSLRDFINQDSISLEIWGGDTHPNAKPAETMLALCIISTKL